MVTQSGGFGFGVVAMAAYYGVGCNYAISTGNEADLDLLDWVADLIERPEVEIVVAFMEGIDDGRRLIGDRRAGARARQADTRVEGRQHRCRQPGGDFAFRADDDGLRAVPDRVQARRPDRDPRRGRADRHRQGVSDPQAAGRQPRGHPYAVGRRRRAARGPLRRARPRAAAPVRKPRRRSCARRWFRSRRPTIRWMPPRTATTTTSPPTARRSAWCSPIRTSTRWWRAYRAAGRPGRGPRISSRCCRAVDKPVILNWPSAPDDNGDVLAYLERNGVPCIWAPAARRVRWPP